MACFSHITLFCYRNSCLFSSSKTSSVRIIGFPDRLCVQTDLSWLSANLQCVCKLLCSLCTRLSVLQNADFATSDHKLNRCTALGLLLHLKQGVSSQIHFRSQLVPPTLMIGLQSCGRLTVFFFFKFYYQCSYYYYYYES